MIENKDKLIIIINGKGGSGKDTCVEFVQDAYPKLVFNVSTIDPIKRAAMKIGWAGAKTDKDRKFLADLKQLSTEYNDYCTQYILDQIEIFKVTNQKFMFIHCREPENIRKIESYLTCCPIRYETLLIKRTETENHTYGNTSDDNVDDYSYNYTFYNNTKNIGTFRYLFMNFFKNRVCSFLFKGGE